MFNFNDILGQEHLIKSMRNDIKYDKVSHTYLIVGENSVAGALANAFAKTLLCEQKKTVSCDDCFSCRAFDNANHPDVIYAAATKTKAIGVLDAKEQIVAPALVKPYTSDYKIFIIHYADTMTTEAQNAILKSIEEPNSYCIFLLLAENSNLFLPTILSRCVILKTAPLSHESVTKYLAEKGVSADIANSYAAFANGSIEKAEKLYQSDSFLNVRQQAIDLLSSAHHKDEMLLFAEAKKLEAVKDTLPLFLSAAFLWFRDLLMAKSTKTERFILQKDKQGELLKLSKEFTYNRIYNGVNAVLKAEHELSRNANTLLVLEMMLLTIASHID